MTANEPSPEDSALRPAGSDLHPADPADDLTANTAYPEQVSAVASRSGPADPAGRRRPAPPGRESAAARTDTSDDVPTPTETPAD